MQVTVLLNFILQLQAKIKGHNHSVMVTEGLSAAVLNGYWYNTSSVARSSTDSFLIIHKALKLKFAEDQGGPFP